MQKFDFVASEILQNKHFLLQQFTFVYVHMKERQKKEKVIIFNRPEIQFKF